MTPKARWGKVFCSLEGEEDHINAWGGGALLFLLA